MSDSTTVFPSEGKIVLVLGAPGSGKGTLCGRLTNDADFNAIHHGRLVSHKSAGDILRGLMAQGGLPPEQKRKVEKQQLMNGKDLARLLGGEVDKAKKEGRVLVLDGVPRNMEQLKAFHTEFGSVDLVVALQCPRDIALQRYLGRHDPTRPDGDVQLFAKRFAEFQIENPGIVESYKRIMPNGVIEVDVGSTDGVDDSYEKLKVLLKTSKDSPWFEKDY